jgi:hypothetical protein
VSTLHEENLRGIIQGVISEYPDFVAADDLSPKAGVFTVSVARVDTPREGASGEDALDELLADLVDAINAEDFEVMDSQSLDNSFRLQVTSRFRVGGNL